MVVYADVLIVLNLIVDYFLLRATGKLISKNPKLIRQLFGAALGALSSLYIFLPQSNFAVELMLRITVCFFMVLLTFGFHTVKAYLKASAILFAVTCGYAGIMIAMWYIFRPDGMIINNSIVYFDISPVVLVASTVVGYIIFSVCSVLISRGSKCAEKCSVTVYADEKCVDMTAILDTGNSVEDILGNSEIIISDKENVELLFGNILENFDESLQHRYRVIPCGTVSGGGILEGYRCDSAVVCDGKKTVTLKKPILAISRVRLNDDYSAIINPDIFL